MSSRFSIFLCMAFIATIFSLGSSHRATVMEADKYAEKVTKRIVSLLENGDFTGNLMPMRVFDIPLEVAECNTSGTVDFHSGFVSRIESAVLDQEVVEQVLKDWALVKATLVLGGVQTVYDVNYKFKNYNENGSLLVLFKEVRFKLDFRRWYFDGKIDARIVDVDGYNTSVVINIHPISGYSQLLKHEMESERYFRQPLADSFTDWSNSWQKTLTQAVSEFDFPEINYYPNMGNA